MAVGRMFAVGLVGLGLVVRDGRHRVAVGIRDDRSLTASTVVIGVDHEATTRGAPG